MIVFVIHAEGKQSALRMRLYNLIIFVESLCEEYDSQFSTRHLITKRMLRDLSVMLGEVIT